MHHHTAIFPFHTNQLQLPDDKGKEILPKLKLLPQSESFPRKTSDPEQARLIRICKRTLHSLLNTTPRYNPDNHQVSLGIQGAVTVVRGLGSQSGVKDHTRNHKDKKMMCKQAETRALGELLSSRDSFSDCNFRPKNILSLSQLKEKTKVISDLKVKEGKDIDTMIEMEKQIKFLNEILYKRNQSIQNHTQYPKMITSDPSAEQILPPDGEENRTKKPQVVPISASKPKRKAIKSVATPHKKTVASDTTIQKSKSYYKEFLLRIQNRMEMGIAKRVHSSFTGSQKPLKTKKIWIPKIRKANESTSISPTIDIVSRITNGTFRILEIISLLPILVRDADLELLSEIYKFCDRSSGRTMLLTSSPTQAWLWHRRLSHLNFDYITLLSKKEVVTGLPKLKYVRDQLCSSCEMSKAKRSSFKTKAVPSSKGRLNLLHMDLCFNALCKQRMGRSIFW
ncbi:retrovirus-related pol polyprotein from transposon TNT 1-94 [Tanacetum coccineum]